MKGGETLRIAPIVHTRTYSCDFNSEFMVRPDTFMDSDIKWARKNVLNATGAIDGMHGERWLVIDNGKYRIAGLVGFLKNICEKCNLSNEELEKSQTLFCDDKGRLVYAFIGIVIDKANSFEIGEITYEYLWRKFLELIFPIWKRTYQEVILKSFVEERFEKCNSSSIDVAENFGTQKLYEVNATLDMQRFQYYLGNIAMSNFSFCSNLTEYNLVKQCDFTAISTSRNIIVRMNRIVPPAETENAIPLVGNIPPQPVPTQSAVEESNNTKKKSLLVLTICLLILVIIILISLLLTGNSNQTGQSALAEIQYEMLMDMQNTSIL